MKKFMFTAYEVNLYLVYDTALMSQFLYIKAYEQEYEYNQDLKTSRVKCQSAYLLATL